ncbi:hypothetical protein AB0D97_12765 [Streptomyces roseus]|uniref:helix-turn-helix domain-containing protein n=1 Tax=Streptomyces roseus TaxID=66430 RepID=UPI0033F63428
MSIAAIVELLNAGHSERAIARQLAVSPSRVQRIRREHGIPAHRPGPTPAGSLEDAFWRRVQHTDDGHLLWPSTVPMVRSSHEGRKESVRRIAFRIRHRREPVGKVLPDCGQPGCVHPDHVADQPMRKTYAAIFGKAA